MSTVETSIGVYKAFFVYLIRRLLFWSSDTHLIPRSCFFRVWCYIHGVGSYDFGREPIIAEYHSIHAFIPNVRFGKVLRTLLIQCVAGFPELRDAVPVLALTHKFVNKVYVTARAFSSYIYIAYVLSISVLLAFCLRHSPPGVLYLSQLSF